jgi:ABC-2 type transport system ATP-binding protein
VQLEPGRVVGLLGPNGAGKTTTLRMLLGLVTPTAGSATIDGEPYCALDEPIRHVGAVLEATSFHPGRRAREHLRVLAATAGLPDERVDKVLADVGLTAVAHRRVGGFSLGMRQRLGLAAALLGDPEILVLDEPTNGLDPEGVRWLRQFVRGYAAAGRTVVVSSHLLAEVAQTVDDVVVLAAGRLVAHAPLAELAGFGPVVQVRTPQAVALRAALNAEGIQSELAGVDLVVAHDVSTETVGRAIAAAGLVAYEIAQQHTDLEQAFLHLTTTATGARR